MASLMLLWVHLAGLKFPGYIIKHNFKICLASSMQRSVMNVDSEVHKILYILFGTSPIENHKHGKGVEKMTT